MRSKSATTPDGPAVRLGEYAVRQAQRLRKNVAAAVKTGDVEAVHDLRVASRRLHEALRVMPAKGRSRQIRVIDREARVLRQAFRQVRDLDVMIASLGDMELDPSTRARLEGLLVARRERRLKRAVRDARRVSLRRLQERVKSLADKLSDGGEVVILAAEMYRDRAAQLAAPNPADTSDPDLHPARIALKRVRYAAELLERAGGRACGGLPEQLARMQDRLGHWNDCVMAARRLAKLARSRAQLVDTPWSEKLFHLSAAYVQAADRERQRVVEHWPELIATIRALADAACPDSRTQTEREAPAPPREEQFTP